MLFGDQLKLNQILYNLLGNSIKFTHSGFIQLTVKCLEKNDQNCMLFFEVKDTGIGISEDKIEHIFEPFVQEDEGIKEKYGGTGLGLSIVKDFVELMGGKIECNSVKNSGTSFTFILNFEIPKEINDNKKVEDLNRYMVFKDSYILILEDNLINQEILNGYLGSYNTLHIIFKENGEEGLKEVKRKKYDLIMSDIMMPKMDGKEFCKQFRNFNKDTPLIALTAFDSEKDRNELIEIGFNYIINKPYKKDELIKGLLKYIPVREISEEDKKILNLAEKASKSDKIDRFKKLFLNDLYSRYIELEEGLKNKNKEKLKFFSHNLNGIAPTLGFPQFAELAEKTSRLYKEDNWDELIKVKDEFMNMVDELEKNL